VVTVVAHWENLPSAKLFAKLVQLCLGAKA